MEVITESLTLDTKGNCQIVDITEQVSGTLNKSGLSKGIVVVFVPGATGGLTTVEYEPGLVKDLQELFDRLAPSNKEYHHNLKWHDGNGHSHVRASLLGPSITIPFVEGRLILGTWQQLIFIDFDVRSRSRNLVVHVMGE